MEIYDTAPTISLLPVERIAMGCSAGLRVLQYYHICVQIINTDHRVFYMYPKYKEHNTNWAQPTLRSCHVIIGCMLFLVVQRGDSSCFLCCVPRM